MITIAFEEFLLGKRQRLSWVNETSYGSGGTMSSGDIIGLNARIEPDFNHNWQEVLTAGADDRYVQNKILGPLALPFNLVLTPVDWKFIQYLGYSVADTGSDPYTHTFTISNTITSFKLEWALRHTTDVVITLTGCVVTEGTMSFAKSTGEGEGFLDVTLKCFAKAFSIGSTVTTISNITASPFQWRHTKLTLETSEVVEVNNGEINISQGINDSDSRYCNSTLDRAVGEPIPKTHRITGRFNVNLKDSTHFDAWDSAAVLSGTNKLEFIRGASDNINFAFTDLRLHQGIPPTNLDSVAAADLVWSSESFASLIATDSTPTY